MKGAPVLAAITMLLACTMLALIRPNPALAVDHNFAGSAQVDYHLVPTVKDASARPLGFDGFTVEAGLKLAADVSDHLSANVKLCYGCHGFEADMAYFDYRVADELNFRVGRFSPSFGSFNVRHDTANHRLSDKPLPYDMGRMLRLRGWNLGVLPSPFPDNGLEANGKLSLGESASVDYAAYAVSGFKGDARGSDLDFVQSRSFNLYYVDNNSRPTVGGRLALTLRLASVDDVTIGASVMSGNYDPNNQLGYAIVGADLVFRFNRTNLRFEYLARRQEFDTTDPTRFKYQLAPNGAFFVKHGGYAEMEQPVSSVVDLIGRVDGLFRKGNVIALPPGLPEPADGVLTDASWVVRYTLGTAVSIERDLRLKASTELWQWSDADAAGHKLAVGVHVAGVCTF